MVTFNRPAVVKEIPLPRLRVSYLDWPGDAPPVVLMHPNRTNARVWDFVVEESTLANRFIAPDARGHGLSDYPERGYVLQEYVRDFIEFLDAMQIDQVVLVGAATGGNIALLIATQYAARIAGLVVADPGLSLDKKISSDVKEEIVKNFRFPDYETAKAAMPFSALWSDDMKDHYATHGFKHLESGEVEWRYYPAGAQYTEGLLEDDMWDDINVTCPTLMMRGSESHVFPAHNMKRLQEMTPTSEAHNIDDCDHRISQDQPALMASLIDDFVKRRVGTT
jgi:pimeloyl-ACP methyl ester carboxylesterase